MNVRLAVEPFDPGVELSAFCENRASTGAVASFIGIARGEPGQGAALELEAYLGFTEVEIENIVEGARLRFALHDVRVVHRIGKIGVGEAIVLVMTASAHRRAALEACDFLIDYLKSKAPFWKREFSPSGPRWVEPTVQDFADLSRWN
jgi:molybdopterin synthase catalytic subunit